MYITGYIFRFYYYDWVNRHSKRYSTHYSQVNAKNPIWVSPVSIESCAIPFHARYRPLKEEIEFLGKLLILFFSPVKYCFLLHFFFELSDFACIITRYGSVYLVGYSLFEVFNYHMSSISVVYGVFFWIFEFRFESSMAPYMQRMCVKVLSTFTAYQKSRHVLINIPICVMFCKHFSRENILNSIHVRVRRVAYSYESMHFWIFVISSVQCACHYSWETCTC